MKQLFNIQEKNAIKLESISRILNKTKTQVINELIEKNLIVENIEIQKKIDEIQKLIQEQQKVLLS